MEQEWDETSEIRSLEAQEIGVEEHSMNDEPTHLDSDDESLLIPEEGDVVLDDTSVFEKVIDDENGRMTLSFVLGVLLLTVILI